MAIMNTWFKLHPRKLYTWKSPMDKPGKIVRNQIDFILVSQRFRNSCIAVKTYSGVDIQSDHIPLVGIFKIRMKRIIPKSGKRYDLRKLKDPDVRKNSQSELNSKLTRINNNTLINVEKEINTFQKAVKDKRTISEVRQTEEKVMDER